jgi:predicted lysophospholipase L1 biosynthesis ABC-type transport system permease subunit
MRMLARSATSSLVALCVALALAVAAVAAIGMVSIRSATSVGNTIAGDELTTAVVTGQVGRDIDAAYATGEAAVQATQSAGRSRMLALLQHAACGRRGPVLAAAASRRRPAC